MIGALGGLTVVAMLLSMKVDARLVPVEWFVATSAILAYAGGVL